MKWTASVSFYDDGETLRWSVRMWRVGWQRRSARWPDVKWTGSGVPPLTEEPQAWLRAALEKASRA